MSSVLNSRSIAEHLFTLAGLLDCEARRMALLRLESSRKLHEEARDVQRLAERLWTADLQIETGVGEGPAHDLPIPAHAASPVRHSRRRQAGTGVNRMHPKAPNGLQQSDH